MSSHRLVGLLAVLAGTTLLSICAASARAAGTLNQGGSFGPTTFNFQAGSSTFGVFCTTTSEDPGNTVCGHQEFTIDQVPGTLTASVTYPSAGGANLISLTLCEENASTAGPVGNCPLTSNDVEVACATDTTTDPTNGTGTYTITCPITSAGTYELLVVPNSVFSCDATDPSCTNGGLTGTVPATLVGSYGGVVSLGPENGRVEGGGDVAPQEHFSLHAVNDPTKWAHTHVYFGISTNGAKCKFQANGATFVNIQPIQNGTNEAGGSAEIQGQGTVTNSLGVQSTVSYVLRVTDGGGQGQLQNPDTFALTAPGCDTQGITMTVVHGQIDVDPDSPNGH